MVLVMKFSSRKHIKTVKNGNTIDENWKRLDINEADTAYARSRCRMALVFLSPMFAAEVKM